MTVTSGFFNSTSTANPDRLYDADAFNEVFKGILTDGVLKNVGDAFYTVALSGMDILVGSGKAWFNDSWIDNDAGVVITISPSFATLSRIDLIVLDFNKSIGVRSNRILVVEGSYALSPVPPTLIMTADHKQYPLAKVTVSSSVTEILPSNIVTFVGTPSCPWANGILEVDFTTEIDTIKSLPRRGRNMIINGSMYVARRTGVTYNLDTSSSDFDDHFGPDRWRFFAQSAGGIWWVGHGEPFGPNVGYGRSLVIHRVSGSATLPSNKAVYLSQKIYGNRVGELHKGTEDALNMVLSFDFSSNVLGTYVVEIVDINGRSISKQYTCDIVDEQKHVSIVIPKDTDPSGFINQIDVEKMRINFWLAAGSMYNSGAISQIWSPTVNANRAPGQVHFGANDDEYFSLTNVQLEIGDEETIFEILPSHDVFSECEAFYEEIHSMYVGVVSMSDPTTMYIPNIRFTTRKLLPPTVVFNNIKVQTASGFNGVLTNVFTSIYSTIYDEGEVGTCLVGTLSGFSLSSGDSRLVEVEIYLSVPE